jgi:FHS family L-fucose permease-like MFS transporter
MNSKAPAEKQNRIAFIVLVLMFFGWGFVVSNNDPLLTSLKAAFHLSWSAAIATQITSFIACGIVSIPAAICVSRIGASKTIFIALLIMIAACFIMQALRLWQNYYIVLFAVFIMSAGVNGLQVAASPLVAGMGASDNSHFRLTLAQTLNSLGVVLGVHFGSEMLLSRRNIASLPPIQTVELVGQAYIYIAIIILLLLVAVLVFLKPFAKNDQFLNHKSANRGNGIIAAFKSRWALFGAASLALYVGSEVAIGSMMINFLHNENVMGLDLKSAGFFLGNFYWGGALLGRFIGTYTLRFVKAYNLLVIAAICAAGLCLLVILGQGVIVGYAALLVGFFNSIQFPTIFTLTLERSKATQAATSGLLVLAISFGAALPFIVGLIADNFALNNAFIVPLLAYCFIAIFAFKARKSIIE